LLTGVSVTKPAFLHIIGNDFFQNIKKNFGDIVVSVAKSFLPIKMIDQKNIM
jgi:hypothetical protein